jgi:glycosyltransferase involved in cell wall biosynthesis
MPLNKKLTVCYFGIYNLKFPRDTVYLRGLEQLGVDLIECIDTSKSFFERSRNLIKKHRQIKNSYDVLFVTYLSNIVVPLARLISRKKIIYNALNAMYEGVVIEREQHSKLSFKAFYFWFMDFVAFHAANIILVESSAQIEFISKTFLVPKRKLVRMWTGADEKEFYPDPLIKKLDAFTVLFRGQLAPFVGIHHIIEAANILRNENIKFIIRGWGMLTEQTKEQIKQLNLPHVTFIERHLSSEELRTLMLSSHVSLGQFAKHERAERTIPNKTYESLAMKLPFITNDSKSNLELLKDRVNAVIVKSGSAKDLADKIILLQKDKVLREKIAEGGYKLFKDKASAEALGKQLLGIINQLVKR